MRAPAILIVDDDVSARNLLGTLIRTHCQSRIETAADGGEAMRKLREHDFDMAWMDIEMPGSDGFETLEVALGLKPDLFVVMVSARGSLEYVKRAIESGAQGFLAKPYTSAKVKEIVEKFLSHRQRSSAP